MKGKHLLKVVPMLLFSAAAMLAGAGRGETCQWSYSYDVDCYRVDVYECPVYVLIGDTLVPIDTVEVERLVLAHCALV